MNEKLLRFFLLAWLSLGFVNATYAQSSTASISGTVTDPAQAVVSNASVTVRNTDTGFTRTVQTDAEGRYRLANLPIGAYEVTVEAANFGRFVQTGITLVVNQDAVVDAGLKTGAVQETVTITENASVLNTTTAEVSTRFDEKRLSELPIAPNRNVYTVLLSVPGVSQLGSGQQSFANGISFSSNGGRIRSNNFMVDGQDINDPSLSGGQIQLNNPDSIKEVRIVTNQFLAEYGRNSGSVVNFIGKSGTNDFRGSAFIFHNNQLLNACSNLNKAAGFCNPEATDESRREAPFRSENQYGFTFGGPLPLPFFGEGTPYILSGEDRTFFFGDYQRWTDRQLGSGVTLRGAPTEAGRQILQSAVGNRPQVAALLQFLPAGTANGQTATFTAGGTTYAVPLGNLTGVSAIRFNNDQGSIRIDHRFNDKNLIYGRYRFDDSEQSGAGQVTPPGVTNLVTTKSQIATIVLNSILSSRVANEFRVAYARYDSTTNAADPSSETIPSIEIAALGLTGFNAAANRTAIGLAVNLPQFRINNTYQITDGISYTTGNHNFKFGVDLRKTEVKSFFVPTLRGRLSYSTLQNFVDDIADTAATVNRPLRGGDVLAFYEWNEVYGYGQDEWKIRPNFTLTYGLRYEYPGDSFGYLKELNQRILVANNNDPRYAFTPQPEPDKNNFMPRIGFNYNPRFSEDGFAKTIFGGDRTVFRGGYARSYDANFININLNVFSAFPFLASATLPAAGAFTAIQNFTPNLSAPLLLARTIVGEDFRSPASDQFSLEMQRELTRDAVFRVGYVGTRGTGLFQTIDANPRSICATGTATNPCPRVDPTRGVIRLRANAANSIYHSLQASFDKRLSNNFSAGFHYTFSKFIDTASEVFNPSGAEVAIAQDSFNLNADRAVSTYDRPHRFTGNFVYEIPFFNRQEGFLGRLLGGFQVNSFFSIQSGAPFTVLLGADPTGALNGIDGLVGNAIRPNLNTTMDLSSMSILDIYGTTGVTAARSLFRGLDPGQRVGNAGRNILRADGFTNVDFGIIKNTRVNERINFQIRADFFNATNTRNFGIPEGRINASNFLDQWGTDGGNRRVILGGRLTF